MSKFVIYNVILMNDDLVGWQAFVPHKEMDPLHSSGWKPTAKEALIELGEHIEKHD